MEDDDESVERYGGSVKPAWDLTTHIVVNAVAPVGDGNADYMASR